jgi:hypothetical protein
VIAALLALALGFAAPTATNGTNLTVTVWPEGRPGPSKAWTLRCSPAGGTLPARAAACRRLYGMTNPFRPIPKDALCTMVYGGPQVAHVRGTYRGRRLDTWFQRRNGCEISRWNRVGFLFPGTVDA